MNPSIGLQQMARRQPGHPAILWNDGAMSYGQMEAQVAAIAGGLRDLPSGARVALIMQNCPEFLPALFGIWRAGLVAVPENARLHEREHAWILENSGAALAIASPALADALAPLAPCPVTVLGTPGWDALLAASPVHDVDSDPDDPAWLFYTSGTTGRPKGAVITHRNLMAVSWAYYADVDQIGPRDIRLHAAPLTHGSGLYAVPFILRGAQNLILPGAFQPGDVFEVLARHRNVSFFAAPTMVSRLVDAAPGGAHPGLKTLEYGGAPMYLADLKRALAVFGPRLYQLYGQGESPMTITHVTKAMHADTSDPAYDQILSGAGVARTGCRIAIVDENWTPQPPGTIGEIATKSDCVIPGYWQNPKATAKTIRNGWLKTGDVGQIDAAGFLTLMDRSKDMVISGGMNIYPREIEEILLTHPGVAECSVVGRPDPDWGEALVAFVVARDATANAQTLNHLCLQNLARFKRPKDWRFVDALPKNNYGKILKTDLRQMLEEGP